MAGFGDVPLVGPGSELQLTIDGRAVLHDEVAELHVLARAGARETTTVEVGEGLEHANLFAVAEQLAARAARRRSINRTLKGNVSRCARAHLEDSASAGWRVRDLARKPAARHCQHSAEVPARLA